MGKGEQKNIVNEVLEVFDSFIVVNLEQNTYTYHFRGEDDAHFESAERGAYTDYVRSLYCGVCPLEDESATLEEYLVPASIRRQMTPGRELLQWEYESSAKIHKTLYALCIQRKDDVPVGLLLASQDSGCQAEVSQIFKAIEPSLSILAESVPDFKNRETDRECLKQKDYQGRRLLVVDDNALSREITEELLRMTGMEVETAVNGKEAVSQMAAAPDGYYDMILMDVQMPVMSGYDAARAIRFLGREQAGRIPIVAMTSGISAEDIAVRESGMSDCLEKPVRPSQLMETLDKYLA
ncbi:MAG: response regulator [Acetatifactor sp.]|nr:response regulator [Acetatifactor sp.]